MAERIKGITIQFRGDTSSLDTALNKVKSETKGLNSEYNQLQRALKLNPNNVTLLAQKQDLLKRKVTKTKDELNVLRQAQKKLADDPSIDKNSEEWRKVERKIVEAESKVKHFESELRKLGDVKLTALGGQLKDAGEKAKNVGDNLTRNVTAPIAGIGAAAVKVGMDFDAEMSKVAAISGATGGEFDKLREKAREMGSATKFTATEAGEGFEYMAMAGWKTGDMLEGIEPILNLATASGEELGATSDIVTDALTAFGLTASDTSHFADVLAQASSNANTNVGLMGETFKYVAPVAGSLSYSAEDTALAIGLMANSGIKASQAGTSLRSIMSRMASPTKQSRQAMDELGLSLTNSDGTMKSFREIMIEARTAMAGMTEEQKTQIASNLAGKNAMSGFLAIVNATDSDFNKLAGSIDNCDGATQKMADTMMNNTKGGITTMISALQNAAITISDVLSPWITKLAKDVENLANWFSNLSPTAQQIILVLAGIAAALGPVISVGSRLAIIIGTLMMNLPGLAAGASGLLGPIGLVVAAVAAAIAIGVALYKNWDKIKAAAGRLKKAVVNAFKEAGRGLINAISAWFDIITAPFRAAWGLIKKIAAKIRDVFNFDFKLPDIKTPHFYIDPKGWQIGDLLDGVIPTLGIDWHKDGAIFKRPTIIGRHGFGEAGAEAAVPLDPFWDKMDMIGAQIADSVVNGVMTAMALQGAGSGGPVIIENYLYKSGPQLGETIVREYDKYKKILG